MIPIIENLSDKLDRIENIIFFNKQTESHNNSIKSTYQLIKEIFYKKNINSNIIIYQSRKTPHDWYILTNNLLLKSGDSFDYFNKNGSYKTNGTTLTIKPVFNANRSEFINLVQVLIDIYSTDKQDMFYGEKSKNILDLLMTSNNLFKY